MKLQLCQFLAPGGDHGNFPMQPTQSSTVLTAHGGVEGERSKDVIVADGIWEATVGDEVN